METPDTPEKRDDWLPVDDPNFMEWVRDEYGEPQFAYGVYDSQWIALYDDYLEYMEYSGE